MVFRMSSAIITSRQFHPGNAINTLGDMDSWRRRFRDHMATAEVTQDYLAEKMKITQGAIAHWLSGRREINLSDFFRLCEFAGVDPQRILFGVNGRVPGMTELEEVLSKYPGLRPLLARPATKNDSVSAALGPTPPRRARRRAPAKHRQKQQKP